MTPGSRHRRFGPVMWGTIGITLSILALVAVLGLDPRITGYAMGALILVCLAVCVAAFWMDSRAERASARLAERTRLRGHARGRPTGQDPRPNLTFQSSERSSSRIEAVRMIEQRRKPEYGLQHEK